MTVVSLADKTAAKTVAVARLEGRQELGAAAGFALHAHAHPRRVRRALGNAPHGCTLATSGAAEQQFIDLPRAPSGCQHPRATYIQQTLNMAYSDPPFPARACVPFVQMEAGQSQAGQQDAVSGEQVHQDRREIFPFYHDDCQDNRRPPAAGREPNVSTDSPLGGMANDDPDGPSLPLWGRLPQCQ